MDHYLRPGQRSSKREHPGIHEGVIASCRVVLHSTAKHFVLADFVRGLFRSFKSSTQEQASPARHRLLIRHHEAEQGLATTFCISRSVTRYCRPLRRTNEMHAKGELLGRPVVFLARSRRANGLDNVGSRPVGPDEVDIEALHCFAFALRQGSTFNNRP